jgi:hypothetical protein
MFLGTLADGLLAAPAVGPAQPASQAARIGFLWGGTLNPSLLSAFEDAMRERGWVSGAEPHHRAPGGRGP